MSGVMYMRLIRTSKVCFAALMLLLLNAGIPPAYSDTHADKRIPVFDAPLSIEKTAEIESPTQKLNPMHMLVVFTQFKGESPGDSLPPWWAPNMFDGNKGSVTHYFDEISHGIIKVTGEYYPKRLDKRKNDSQSQGQPDQGARYYFQNSFFARFGHINTGF